MLGAGRGRTGQDGRAGLIILHPSLLAHPLHLGSGRRLQIKAAGGMVGLDVLTEHMYFARADSYSRSMLLPDRRTR